MVHEVVICKMVLRHVCALLSQVLFYVCKSWLRKKS